MEVLKFTQLLPQLPAGLRTRNYLLGPWAHFSAAECEDIGIAGHIETDSFKCFYCVSVSQTLPGIGQPAPSSGLRWGFLLGHSHGLQTWLVGHRGTQAGGKVCSQPRAKACRRLLMWVCVQGRRWVPALFHYSIWVRNCKPLVIPIIPTVLQREALLSVF